MSKRDDKQKQAGQEGSPDGMKQKASEEYSKQAAKQGPGVDNPGTSEEEAVRDSRQAADEVAGDTGELQRENERLRDQLLRQRAEFENYKRRRSQEFDQMTALATESLIADLLPVLDDLDLLLKNAEKSDADTPMLEGARMIRQKLYNVLQRRGLEALDAEGATFDPELHEALMQMPVEGAEPGTVVDVHQTGYRLGEKLIRPSRVIVAAESGNES